LEPPIPSLPSDFDRRLVGEALRSAQQTDRYRRLLFTGYGVVSVAVSVVLMRGQGLGWGATAGMILAPLALIAAVRSADRIHR
jgi:hypothetical protein